MQSQVWCGAMAFTLAIVGTGCSSEEASSAKVAYLALGDSIAYGENIFVPDTDEARPNGDAFVGYPDLLGREAFGGEYANLGCPGVTTASYLSLEGDDFGCRQYQEEWLHRLHVPYTSAQADKAQEILQANDVRVVTVSLGGNDLLQTLAECRELTPDDPDATFDCAIGRVPETIMTGADNLEQALQRLREDFDGELIYVNLYSTYAADDPATLAIRIWNDTVVPIVEDAGGEVADAFSAFADEALAQNDEADPCAAGLLIPNPDEGEEPACDVHPSETGARLLADTVAATPGFP